MTDTANPEGPEQRLARIEEALWVAEAKGGNTEAFGRLMDRYEKPLLYYLRRLIPDGGHALDLHQETWMDAYRGLSGLQSTHAFRVWIYRIAHHKAVKFLRVDVPNRENAVPVSDDIAAEPTVEPDGKYSAEGIHQALALLPTQQREILILYYLRDHSTAEIAEVLECPVGTVKSKLFHARAAMKKILIRNSL
jgi:RNA polymerase sigma-70 factor (ECF subfamily)